MNVMPLTDEFAVTAQISVDDVSAIAEAGYKTIICNRPDYETADQPVFADIKAAAEAAGSSPSKKRPPQAVEEEERRPRN